MEDISMCIGNGIRLGTAVLLGMALSSGVSHATDNNWPERPITLIVPFSPGGITDTLARSTAERMSKAVGQAIVVQNRPGASSTIGANFVSRAPADGYTVLLASDSTNTLSPLLYKNVKYTFEGDFDAIGEIGYTPFALVVNPSLPANDVHGFVEYARAHPGKIDYASTGTGGAYHLAGELLADQNNIKLTHIPYKGGGDFIVSLLNGDTQAVFGALVTFAPHIAAGKLRALAVSADQRLAAFPKIPTFKESGFPEYSAQARFGLTVPKGTPKDVRDKLTAALNSALQDQSFRSQFESEGVNLSEHTSADDYINNTKADAAKWSLLVRKLNITLE
jgi:tripartite-type tricarboxylate transporter receptor subunit TctC